jgi:secondary thiamine-phosphate synthase enzyme
MIDWHLARLPYGPPRVHGAAPCAINTRPAGLAAGSLSTGGIAQLGERRVRIAKARGSSPLTSTLIEFSVETPSREILVDITPRVRTALTQSAADLTGVVNIFVPHTTAGVTINEGADPSVARDLVESLARLVPREAGYRHGEGNSDAHIKTSLMGSHVAVPVERGRLRLGTWQSIYLAEFDGPRTRKVWIVPLPDGSAAIAPPQQRTVTPPEH